MISSQVFAALGLALVLGVAVPWAFVRAFVPALQGVLPARRTNYAGRTVFIGLGAVWIVWSLCLYVMQFALEWLDAGAELTEAVPVALYPDPSIVAMLALVACALGMVDDAYGTGDDRGFGGHVRALLQGRLSTGMLKLLGISAASAIAAFALTRGSAWVWEPSGLAASIGYALLAGAGIALTSNFVNLTDLRPGRALKAYTLLAAVGAILSGGLVLGIGFAGMLTAFQAVGALTWLILALGPVVAVWRYDVGERGMLGDAGANAMGAVAGLLIVAGLPMWGVAIYTVVMLALNLASERVSFSRVIDSTPPLRWLDRLGRPKDMGPTSQKPETSNPSDVSEG